MIRWGERPQSPEISTQPGSAVCHFVLSGTTNGLVAKTLAVGYSPVLYENLVRQNIEVACQGFDVWYVDVTYGPIPPPEEGEFKWTFDTTGQTQHITQALEHITEYADGPKESHGGTIGVTENGDIEGVDVPCAGFKWTENWQLLLASYGWTYSTILGEITGSVNSTAFRGFDADTVMFMGATGSQSTKDPLLLDITYSFEHSKSVTGQTVGPIPAVAKKGWEYAWVEYVTTPGAVAKRLLRTPRQVNVERVSYREDFAVLGIGG